MIPPLLTATDLPGLRLLRRGKVRDVYDLGREVLLVSTDRVSAFDVVLSPGIPYKGAVLNTLSAWWFRELAARGVKTHFLGDRPADMPPAVAAHADALAGRATLGRRARIVPVECVVRGYLAGSAAVEYRERGTINGELAPQGLRPGDALPEPLFTPTTKAETGHDEPLAFAEVEAQVGRERARDLRDRTLDVYRFAAARARERGLILVDTKLEWGEVDGGALILCDEALTPDSSRYWLAAEWAPGTTPEPLDKQVVRNHLLGIKSWKRQPPAPPLPPEIVVETASRYLRLFKILTGAALGEEPRVSA
jgi:phosphoribosylaminoimidazole-succinocarboxamide synthase